MNNTYIKKSCAAILIILIAYSMFFVSINNLKVDAATVDSNAYCSNSTSRHNIPSSITNICGPMNSSTYGYTVGNTGDWMCVSPRLSSPTGQYGRVESVSNSSSFTTNRDSLKPFQDKGLSVSQVVYGCCALKSSDWGLAHAVLSFVVNNDATWLDRLTEGGMGFVVREFSVRAANAGLSVSRDYIYYVFTPNGSYTYQRLVNTSYTPTEHPDFASVTFNKVDANGSPINGAVIQFVGNTSASASSLTASCDYTRVDNGIQFVSDGSTVQISGLKPNCTYRFKEISAPAGYSVASDIVVTVDSNCRVVSSTGTGSSITMVDYEELIGTVIFHKVGSDGQNLANAVITFTAASDNSVADPMGRISYVAGSGVNASFDGTTITFTTASVDDQITITGLKPNARYVFHEVHAPEGYLCDFDQTVYVDSQGNVSPDGGHITFRDGNDTNHYGSMRFFKHVDGQIADMIDGVNIYIYQEGYDAPFCQMVNTRESRNNGDNSFWTGPDRISYGHISDSSQLTFLADPWWDYSDPTNPVLIWDGIDFYDDRGGVHWAYTIGGLPESMYTIIEDWIVGSMVDMTTQERIAIDGLNCSGWTRLPSYTDSDGNYHVRFTNQVLVAYRGEGDAGLNHSYFNPDIGFMNSYGAILIENSENSVRFDITKIQRNRDVSELSFQLWTMSGNNAVNHIADGAVTTPGDSNVYSVNWTYQLIYPGDTSPTTLTNVDYINHLPVGTYQIREYAININAYAAPDGWERITDDSGTYFARTIDIPSDGVGFGMHPMYGITVENRTGVIHVQKTDLWTGLPITNYQGTLGFDLYDTNNNLVAHGIDTNKDGVVEFDLFELFPNGNFPNSFYLIETDAPFGYYLVDERIPVTVEDGYAEVTVEDAPYTAQLTIHKLDSDTNEVINFVEFTVYEDTNADGIHQANEPVASSFVNDTLVQSRVEFNGTDYVTTPLRSGHYIIVETGLPEGYFYCDDNGEPTSTPNSFAFVVENRNTTVPNFVVTTYETTMFNAPVDIHTTLLVTETGADVAPLADSVELTDIVTYENLIVGEEFVLEGILMNKETGEPILDENGNPVTGRTVFIPETSDGTVEVSFTINTNFLFDGSNPIDVVCFETLKHGDRTVKIHADINDDNQTIHIVKLFNIELTKLGEQFVSVERIGDRYVPVWEVRTLSDATFAIYAAEDIVTPDGVVRHNAGELIETITTDENGYAISSNLFLGAYRVVEIEAPINYVLGYDEIIVGEDRGDIALYTITAPDCIDLPFTPSLSVYKTLMPGQVNGSNNGAWYVGDFGCVTFGIYANEDIYAPDGTFIPEGGLIEVISCNSRGQATFSVNFPYGSYYVRELTTDMWHYTDNNAYPFEYTRPSSRTEVNNIVSLGIGNSVVNTPENPSICTTMTYNGQHLAPANTVVSLVDRVWYENLKPWQQYEMHGTIMLVHEDGTYEEYMDVGPVVFSTTDIVSGYVDVPFEVDTTDMAGMNLVAFERLTHGSVTVAVHMDINADIQTIHIPSIGTTATVNSSHEFDVTDEIVLTDIVSFENLIPGRAYRVEGVLMDKTYNTPLGVNGSMVTSTATFVPTSPNGTIEVTFRFDGSVLHNNQELVVFERVYDVETNTLVGRHEDFDSPSQTVIVRVPSPTPTPTTPTPSTTPRTSVTPTPTPVVPGTPSTGEDISLKVIFGCLSVFVGFAIVMYALKLRLNTNFCKKR